VGKGRGHRRVLRKGRATFRAQAREVAALAAIPEGHDGPERLVRTYQLRGGPKVVFDFSGDRAVVTAGDKTVFSAPVVTVPFDPQHPQALEQAEATAALVTSTKPGES